ncbi:MAG: hypothetical protein ABW346_01390 [Terrimicrobium sp.]
MFAVLATGLAAENAVGMCACLEKALQTGDLWSDGAGPTFTLLKTGSVEAVLYPCRREFFYRIENR